FSTACRCRNARARQYRADVAVLPVLYRGCRVQPWPEGKGARELVERQGVVKPAVVDDASAVVGPTNDVCETTTPQDLVRQIGGTGVDLLGTRLVDAACGDDQLGVHRRKRGGCGAP